MGPADNCVILHNVSAHRIVSADTGGGGGGGIGHRIGSEIPYRLFPRLFQSVNFFFKTHCTDCPPKKLQSAFGYRLQKNPLFNLKNQTGL